jgi:hypothetical protein
VPEAAEQTLLELANAMITRGGFRWPSSTGNFERGIWHGDNSKKQRTYEWDQFDSFNERLNQCSMSRRGEL